MITNRVKFLEELSYLMDKHNVALCSKRKGDYSEVMFQFSSITPGKSHKTKNLHTGRTHSTGYELRCIRNEISSNNIKTQ